MDPNPQLYPIAVLISDLKSEDKSKRLTSVSSLPAIAAALGPERTRNELVPYVTDLLDDEEDVLCELARQLGTLADAVGGKMHAHILFEPLHQLTQAEDASVRNIGVQSIVQIVTHVDSPLVEEEVMEICRRLAEADWFTHKVSAAALLAGCLQRFSREAQTESLGLYSDLGKDQNLLVRKTVAENLPTIVKHFPPAFEPQVLSVLSEMTSDKEDSVRLLSIPSIVVLGEVLSSSKRISLLLPLVKTLGDDKAWRVRYALADQICKVGKAFSPDVLVNVFCPMFVGFLKDGESEVRTAACTRLCDFVAMLPQDQVSAQILPSLGPLATDSEMVKAAFACQLTRLCSLVGRTNTNEHLLKVMLDLLKDESADIKVCLFKELDSLNAVIGMDSLAQSVLPTIAELAADKQWRVRLQILELMPTFAKQLGAEFFETHFHTLYLAFVGDLVFSIREAVLHGLKDLAKILGAAWVETNVLSAFLGLKASDSYLLRVTALQAVQTLSSIVSVDALRVSMLPLVVALSADRVPNVRMNAAKAARTLSSVLQDAVSQDSLHSVLTSLAQDPDVDVRFIAECMNKDS